MKLLAWLSRPEYIFRPSQIVRRLMYELRPSRTQYQTVTLPWGLDIRVQQKEVVGSGIRRLGVHELATSECICRLIEPGELSVDVGANIGHMTSIMAMQAGPSGQVISFEPHPVLYKELQYNVTAWKQNPNIAPITTYNVALSNNVGSARLAVPADYESNHGVCSIADNTEDSSTTTYFEVAVTTLTAIIEQNRQISFLKIDVEGHELMVLKGAESLLASGQIRDILFEEHGTLPTPVTTLLQGHGYQLYRILNGLFGLTLIPIDTYHAPLVEHDSPNFLATRSPGRLLGKTSKRGWIVYSKKWGRRSQPTPVTSLAN